VIVRDRGRRIAAFAARKRVKALSGIERSVWLALDLLAAVHTLRSESAEELRAVNMSASEVACRIKVPTSRVTAIVNGRPSSNHRGQRASLGAVLRNQRRVLGEPAKLGVGCVRAEADGDVALNRARTPER
jgi:hypothetical protein